MYKSSSFLVVRLLARRSTCGRFLEKLKLIPAESVFLCIFHACFRAFLATGFLNIPDMLSFLSRFTWSLQGLQWKPQPSQPFDGLRRMCAKPCEALERLPHQNAETG